MLRLGFLPSDFHPMVLILGEAADLTRLGGLLREFAASPADRPLAAGHASGASITLSSKGLPGMRPAAPGSGAFVWCLQPEQALAFAAAVEQLAEPGTLAGSEHLETESSGEIPVKVSRGEYTDDFLLEDQAPALL